MEDWYSLLHDPEKNIYQKFDEQVDAFWNWSKTTKQVKEWEALYPNWTLLNTIFDFIIETTMCHSWDQVTINNLLYIIGRDNETEMLIHKLAEFPESLLFLANEGIGYSDSDTKWQLAHYLTECFSTHPEAEGLIVRYYEDQHEYVKRRSLLALGIIKSQFAVHCALQSWHSGLKYQKLAALEVFKQLDSPYFISLQGE
ncbi:hypothetical protein [Paenibacillus kobensis]|uniref:hypothetical protein n=1 Tax=Paenibacillus kobensis TaxID=59841 RepID=UPI000FDAA739|nr:hypothetical protein [Paenibacillus kobensis]